MKIKFDKGAWLSVASIILSVASALVKNKDAEHKEQVKKEEWILEAMERISKKEN